VILIIDNYDSFTWNLAQAFMTLGEEVKVLRNDKITCAEADALDFDQLVISPGPGSPDRAGRSVELIRHFAGKKPILGVCLGHQAIGFAFGSTITRAARIMHGKTDLASHDGAGVFADLPNPLRVVRYHSLCIARDSVPAGFEITARSSDGEIMGIRNRALRMEGVQFHPESVGTEEGIRLLRNFLSGVRERPSFKAMLRRIASRESLSGEEAASLMDQITEGIVSPAQIGAFLASITLKGPTVAEISGFAASLRNKATRLPLPEGLELTDACGTGGDSSGSFNISTTASFVAAGAGAKMAKHGNRSITSRSGSADVLEALGVRVDLKPAEAVRAIESCGMAFLFATAYHPAFRNIMGPRRELGFRTLFNMMGPMLNPARASSQVMGVYAPELTETAAAVLSTLGVRRALVVHGLDGIDEISLAAKTKVTEVRDGWTRTWILDPEDYGFALCRAEDMKGGEAPENAKITERILSGEAGPKRDVVLLNAAAIILVAGLAPDFALALAMARVSIDSGQAVAVLGKLRAFGDGNATCAGGSAAAGSATAPAATGTSA
jgi:anthranilate synthase/phosphoribosyltransferase